MQHEFPSLRSTNRSSVKMPAAQDVAPRSSSYGSVNTLQDRFELLKEIGDGSFGSVSLARVRTAGANIARRGTLVSKIGLC